MKKNQWHKKQDGDSHKIKHTYIKVISDTRHLIVKNAFYGWEWVYTDYDTPIDDDPRTFSDDLGERHKDVDSAMNAADKWYAVNVYEPEIEEEQRQLRLLT